MDRDDAFDDDLDRYIDQVMAAIIDLPRSLHITQAKTKQLQTQVPVFKAQLQQEVERI